MKLLRYVMNKLLLMMVFFLVCRLSYSQELNCQIVVNAEQTGKTSMTVFSTLENALTEFVNQTDWTQREFLPHERINCSMFINITDYDADSFKGTIQVQSSRPVFGSTMVSPVFNFRDEQFSFEYSEFEPLSFSPNTYESELVAVVSFYVYTILGLDADTFDQQGGTQYYETANRIASVAQQGGHSGWKASDGGASRYRLINDLLSSTYSGYREALYTYHRDGLDQMHKEPKEGKKAISAAIQDLERMNERRPNSLLVRTFFDAKSNEVEQVFSGGPSIPIKEVVEALQAMAPTFSEKWSNIRY